MNHKHRICIHYRMIEVRISRQYMQLRAEAFQIAINTIPIHSRLTLDRHA